MNWHERGMDTVFDEENIKGFFEEYRWLSNYHICLVMWKEIMFKSSEAAYQAAKSLDPREWIRFSHMSAGTSKIEGRKIDIRPDWNEVKDQIMLDICLDKFLRNENLRQKLLDTGDRYLEETNWWNDTYW